MKTGWLSAVSTPYLWLALFTLTACSGTDRDPGATQSQTTPNVDESVEQPRTVFPFDQAASHIQTLAIRFGSDLVDHCETLQRRVHAFLAAPDESGRDATREAFHTCYEHWRRYQLFQQIPFALHEREGFERTVKLINTRPFQPGYIDGLPEYPYSGLVHETDLTLSLSVLLDQHRMMDEQSASLGFPVLEALLWREPLPDIWLAAEVADPPETSAPRRRHEYLALATDDLMVRLKAATQRWRPGNAYSVLPQGAQRRIFWQSAHQLVQLKLLDNGFRPDALEDPEWHHPSALAGQGRRHWLALLAGLEASVAVTGGETQPLVDWLDQAGFEPKAAALRAHLRQARIAIEALPANYPFDAQDNKAWQSAREAVTLLAEDLTHYLQQLDLAPGQSTDSR